MLIMKGVAYLAGAIFGVKAAIQLRDHTENPQQTRLSKPLTSMTVSTAGLALPGVLDMVKNTFEPSGGMALMANCVQAGSSLSTCFSSALLPPGGGASASGLGGVAIAFSASMPGLMMLVLYSAAAAGAFLILKSIFLLPQLEQGRAEASKIIWMMISGVVLWSILPMIDMVLSTEGQGMTSSASLLTQKYTEAKNGDQFEATIASVLSFVQLIGLIAFFRGTLILKSMGENKDGAMGRALTHILAGAAAINIGWTVKILAMSIGAQGSICGLASAICT